GAAADQQPGLRAARPKKKGPGLRPGLAVSSVRGSAQKSMPPPPGIGGAGGCFLGTSATIASVVMSKPPTQAPSSQAVRTTLVGSMMPFDTMFTYSPLCASKPYPY